MKRAMLFAAMTLLPAQAFAQDPPEPPQHVVQRLATPGSPDAFFVEPEREGEQPILLVLHPKNGDAEEDCKKWAAVASPHGWVVCPSGPLGAEHARSWGRFDDAKKVIDGALEALRSKFGARMKTAGNALIGFSEGAVIAQILGIRDPAQWSRWLILAGSDTYWGDPERGLELLQAQRRKIAKVVFLTGENDPVLENTLRAGGMLRAARIPTRVIVRRRLGHEVPAGRMVANYQPSLRWLFDAP